MIDSNILIKYVNDIDFELQDDINKINELVNKGDFKGILNAAYFYSNAENVDDFELFIYYLEMIVDKGYNEALFDLGYAYHHSYDVEDLVVDSVEHISMRYYNEALTKGFKEAYLYMGDFFSCINTYDAREKRLEFYLKAIECGVNGAEAKMAEYYIDMDDYDNAFKYSLIAQEKGHWNAGYLISECSKMKEK